jgi:hypothetical protein
MISKSLEHMHNFFPRINLLAEIYELDKIIAGYVVNVHRNMVFFARDASLYFVKKSSTLSGAPNGSCGADSLQKNDSWLLSPQLAWLSIKGLNKSKPL